MQIVETNSDSVQQDSESKDRQAARLQFTNELNQLLRRFRSYSNEVEWIAALNEGVSRFARENAVFAVQDGSLRLRAKNNIECAENLAIPVRDAVAFSAAIESKDPIVALRTPAEVGQQLSSPDRGDRAHIFPIVNGTRVAAVVFAAGKERIDLNGLELLANVASLALQRPANQTIHTQIAPASVTDAEPVSEEENHVPLKQAFPAWTRLAHEERNLHLRARRFARVKVAEMELARPEACRAGRREGNFYLFLKREIDSARDSYRNQFMRAPGMADYLHLELVGTSAGGNEQKLGADYPGQLD